MRLPWFLAERDEPEQDEARKVQRKSAKKRKGQASSRSRSMVWTFFHKVKVPSKEGLMALKAQRNYWCAVLVIPKVLTRTSMWWRGMKMRRTMLRISSCPRLLMWGITTIDIRHVGVALAVLKMDVYMILSRGLFRSM
nr:uncharacterized protein LOC123494937 isoform X1 [Aegilops tauschii subsp. strangulata]